MLKIFAQRFHIGVILVTLICCPDQQKITWFESDIEMTMDFFYPQNFIEILLIQHHPYDKSGGQKMEM